MVNFVEIHGFQEFSDFYQNLKPEESPVYFYFSGSKLPSGESWCPDCVVAEPIVKSVLKQADKNSLFVYVAVGDRGFWKDKACPFRTDKRTKLMVIPTLMRWKGVQKLEGNQCCNKDLLQMMFEDEE